MRRLLLPILASVVLLFSTVPQTGCALFADPDTQSTEQFYASVQEDYIAAVSLALTAHSAGKISNEDWREKWNPIIQEGNEILNDLDQARIDGDRGTALIARRLLNGVLTRLQTQNLLLE